MTHPLSWDVPRCAGRWARALGSAVLARECVACRRRTSPLPETRAVRWISAPTQSPCPMEWPPEWVEDY